MAYFSYDGAPILKIRTNVIHYINFLKKNLFVICPLINSITKERSLHWWVQGGTKDTHPPFDSISLIFMQFSAEILPNNRFSPQTQRLAPLSGKSRIRQSTRNEQPVLTWQTRKIMRDFHTPPCFLILCEFCFVIMICYFYTTLKQCLIPLKYRNIVAVQLTGISYVMVYICIKTFFPKLQ